MRARRLKDMVYVKDVRAAITSGEFALRLRGAALSGLANYQGLCNRLYTFAEKLQRQPLDPSVLPESEARRVLEDLTATRTKLEDRLLQMAASGGGGGATAAPAATAEASEEPSTASPSASSSQLSAPAAAQLPDPREVMLYLREDKTVDFALGDAMTGATEAARFSRDLWERLNGRPAEGDPSSQQQGAAEGEDGSTGGDASGAELSREAASPRVALRLREVERAGRLLEESLRSRVACVERITQLSHAEGDRSSHLEDTREQLRDCDQVVSECQGRAVLARIEWLLERAASVLEADLERTSVAEWDTTGGQLKLLVAEFTLLERQEVAYRQLFLQDSEGGAGPAQHDATAAAVLDTEELRFLEGDVVEFVDRLGLEVDTEADQDFSAALQRVAGQAGRTIEKVKTGLSFYVDGTKLLWQDLQYAAGLISKAALDNYTLRPREVSTLARTARDLLTFIPFLIILIIPLSPVGHVLVFSFIQKYFPEFFPSTFSERRQNVIKIYRDFAPETNADAADDGVPGQL